MRKRTRGSDPPTTGELINQLSNERLTLYRQGSGHPIPRNIRARLVEIVRELDRLWDVRRRELASPPLQLQPVLAAPPVPAVPAGSSPKTRTRIKVA
jgi:hypothetical protein